ncbi:MAG TPA: MBL fold metallo-hydrolase [Dehalococcoidia bacterium]|nr:MBL fold metallo-hydrolase [Dehalococcoidia bacterium]
MDHSFREVRILRHGDSSGNRMVLQIIPKYGVLIYAISVPRDGFSYTGPTWAYLFENEGLTLVDTGVAGSFSELADGLACAGFRPRDIQRVIVTHGHEDHDGAVAELVSETEAELWAHDIHAHLLPFDPRDIQRRPTSPIQWEMLRVVEAHDAHPPTAPRRERYIERRKGLTVDHRIQPGETSGALSFLATPGHSPDELCIALDGIVFTGDHVLPEISPHPTTKTVFLPEVKEQLPARYHNADDYYGLARYLQSLKLVAELGEDVAVLPAHRFYNRDRFNFINVLRAGQLIQHHSQRLGNILDRIGSNSVGLEQLTRGIFERRKLMSGNLYAALTEIVAHIELLQDTQDLEVTEKGELICTGSENYQQFIFQLTG